MKLLIRLTLLLSSIAFITPSKAQSNFTNAAYEVSDDVIKVEEHTYYETSVADLVFKQTDFNYSSVSTFKNGRIQKQVNDGATFILTGQSQRNYLYNDITKEYSISGKTYKLIEFGNLSFDYPKEEFKIILKSNTNLKLQYNNGNKIITAKYKLLENGNVEETTPDLWYESKSTYNTKGQIIKKIRIDPKEPSKINLKILYTYFNEGLPDSEKRFYQDESKVNHYYILDTKGNWVNKIDISETEFKKRITYTTRKLTYKDSSTSGGIQYDMKVILRLLDIDNKIVSSNKTGCISGDCQNGFGTYKDTEGFTYIGTFKNGMFNGACTWYDKNDRLYYEGNVFEGKLQGIGTTYLVNGDVYEGEFKNNKMDGYGKYSFATGDVYDGEFKKGLFNGNGMIILKSGDAVFGTYKDMIKVGEFTTEYANGDIQNSIYINGKREGESEFIFKSGKKILYTYKNDKVISSKNVDANSTIPNGLVWTKNAANTEYFLYKDGVEIEEYTFWVNNDLYVYVTKTSHEIYLLKDFKIKSADSFHDAELLTQKFNNGVWFKTASGSLGIYNNSCFNISTNHDLYKYADNGIDVLFRESGKKDILLLNNFKNATINKVYPALVYNSSEATSNNATGFQAEINTCMYEEDQPACLYKKFFDNYDALKKSGVSQSDIIKTTTNNLNLVGKSNVEALFNILMDSKKFTSDDINKIVPNIDKDLRAKVKLFAQKVVDDYAKSHKMN